MAEAPPRYLNWLALAAFAAVYATLVYRAATQPITVDEAYIYYRYLQNHPWWELFTAPHYQSSNHVLQTALSYWSVHVFGLSELALRLPALLAAPFYFLVAWRIAFLCVRRLGLAILALGLITANPLLLDHLVLARGYGIALTFYAWAFYFSLRYLQDRKIHLLMPAGALLGFSVSANLTFAVPAASLSLVMLASLPWRPALRYLASALLCATLVLAIPLRAVQMSEFYFGETELAKTLVDLSTLSLFYSGHLDVLPAWNNQYFYTLVAATPWIAALVLLSTAVALGVSARSNLGVRLAGGTLLVCVLTFVAAHHAIGLLYPRDRTGLYLLFLFPLAFLTALDTLFPIAGIPGWAVRLGATMASAALLMFCLQIHIGYFAEWRFAPDLKTYLTTIQSLSPNRAVRIGGGPDFRYLTNFYHDMHLCNCTQTIDEESRKPGYDYYVLLPEDREYLNQLNLRVLRETTQSILATPKH